MYAAVLHEYAADGPLRVDLECLPLSEVQQAWARQRAGVRNRILLVP